MQTFFTRPVKPSQYRSYYIWLLLSLLLFYTFGLQVHAQEKQWDKTFGGDDWDFLSQLQHTTDGGYILGGTSRSGISGDKTGASKGDNDFWIVKLDSAGNKEWDRTFGGEDRDELYSLQQTSDGGYILGGLSLSGISGDKSEVTRGSSDFWIVKLDSVGNLEWDKSFGGDNWDKLSSLQQINDGGYILGGESWSGVSADKSEYNRGISDYWVVKLDSAGNKEWDRTFGGDLSDILTTVQRTVDEGYILGGLSGSGISGDKSEASRGLAPQSLYDFWIVKLDSSGNKVWDKTYGGNNYDALTSLQLTSDGGYILGGSSDSDSSAEKSEASRVFVDYWIVKTDSAGNKEWDRTYGGDERDELQSIQQTLDGGYMLGGTSLTGMNGDKSEDSRGDEDFWVVKLDSAGNKKWDRTFGGENGDALMSLLQISDGSYILGGASWSGISGDKTEASRGSHDYWVVKLNGDTTCTPIPLPDTDTTTIYLDFESEIFNVLLKVFPNPFFSWANIEFELPVTGTFRLELYNHYGTMLGVIAEGMGQSGQVVRWELNAQKLQEGIYYLKLITPGDVQTVRLVVKK